MRCPQTKFPAHAMRES